MVNPYNGHLFVNEKERSADTYYDMVEPWKRYVSERSRSQKDTSCMISLIWNIPNRQIYRDRKQLSDRQGLKTGKEKWLLMDKGLLPGAMKTFWTYTELMAKPLNCTFVRGKFYGIWIISRFKKLILILSLVLLWDAVPPHEKQREYNFNVFQRSFKFYTKNFRVLWIHLGRNKQTKGFF